MDRGEVVIDVGGEEKGGREDRQFGEDKGFTLRL